MSIDALRGEIRAMLWRIILLCDKKQTISLLSIRDQYEPYLRE